MKGYHVSRSLSQHSSGGGGGAPCHCAPDDCDGPGRDYYHGRGDGHYYSGGPTEALALERHHSHSHSHAHSHSHSHSGTFPRSHPSQHPSLQSFDSCEDCLSSGHGGKMHRIPPNLIDQFEKQVPFHPDGFHTLQYQRTASGGAEHRSESPSRIRHLVNSVQRLFAKSHSLEAPTKREYNGTRGGGEYRGERGGGHRSGGEDVHYSGHQSRSTRRSKSRERSKSGDSRHESGRRHRSRTAGWWSSDDNLDSDSSFLVSGGRRGYPTGHESLDAAIQELTMKKPKDRGGGPGSGECMACTTMALAGSEGGGHHGHHGHSLKRSTWSAMTVSQAREVYPSTRGGAYEKALVPVENKLKERSFHYLQVPSEDWGAGYGGPADSGGEIPCRRMRSGSYIKAMGDDDSADSETSPKASPKSTLVAQRDAFRRSISMYSCKQCTDSYPNTRTAPKTHTRSRSYTRSLTSAQFETVCETMFGEVESQAVEALDLPGVFRTRSHSYVRAIQAGCSQDDDCLSVFSMSGPQGSIKGGAFPYRKGAPPPLPPRMSKSSLSVRAQSSTESTQDAYFQSGGPMASGPGPGRPKQHSNSVDLGGSEGPSGRTSRGGYYTSGGPGRSRQHSNSAESLDGVRGSRELVPYGGGPGVGVRAKHSCSADSLLEGPPRPARERDSRVGGSLGKSSSLPQNNMILSKIGGQDDGRGGRKWRPSIAVQVDSSETLSDSDTEGKALTEVHSIGVQVEDEKATEACQVDSRPHQHPHLPPRSHSPLPITSERAWTATPSLEGPRSLPDSGRASPCMRDGEFFLRLLQTEVERMEGWCQNMEREAEENELPEELELIRNAVGSAQMLMSQKVQQFFRLCQQSIQDPSAYPQPTAQDLASFWDLLQLNIEDVRVRFQDLQKLKDSGWRLPPEKKEDKKLPPPLPKKPAGGVSGSLRADSVGDGVSGSAGGGSGGLVVPRVGGHTLPIREKSLDLGDRQRTEARRRLLQTKRTASFRQNSATESADSIEIYIPEAQTRL
uniref:Discs, large (Drosophila) homolog-associated protein 3 n=1 Tax=Fundulus heteroclitus TaxID=8078 RepID=A0A3Q2QCS9_FUNHE